MKFTEWSLGHALFILAPAIILTALYFIFRNKSQKTIYIVGVVIGVLNLVILLTRNLDIFLRNGFDPEIIPIQVCHLGNVIVFVSLVFKNKTAAALGWCFNLIPAFSSLIFADALANYETILRIRPQAYIWGHIAIVVGGIFPVIFKSIKFDFKAVKKALLLMSSLVLVAIVLNTVFIDLLGERINYFYIYDSKGVPFEMFYNADLTTVLGSWFTINIPYTLFIIAFGLFYFFLFYYIYVLINRKSSKSKVGEKQENQIEYKKDSQKENKKINSKAAEKGSA